MAFVLVRLRALDTAGVLGRTSSLFRAALVAMSLQELAYQILAPPVQFPFEFALAHLPGFAGREEGFGIREDSIGRCARGSARYPCNRSCPRPWLSTGGSPEAAPSSAGTHAPAAALAGLSEVDGWR